MDPLLVLAETHGFFTRAQAMEAGMHPRQVPVLLRDRTWVRMRRGYYTFGHLWDEATGEQRHRSLARAVLHSLGDDVCLSHVSALVELGVRLWGMPLDKVHVTRLDGRNGRVEADVVHHVGLVGDHDVRVVNGVKVMAPDRAVVEAASRATGESALVAFDSLLNQGLATPDDLGRRFAAMKDWPHTQHLHVPIRLADGGAESPGESRGRWLCWTFHLPRPETQFEVRTADGTLTATCDWGWPELRGLGEFDGRVKYGRLLKPGQEPGDVIFAEKRREDQVRELTGFGMVRLIWSDYERPRTASARIARMLGLCSA